MYAPVTLFPCWVSFEPKIARFGCFDLKWKRVTTSTAESGDHHGRGGAVCMREKTHKDRNIFYIFLLHAACVGSERAIA